MLQFSHTFKKSVDGESIGERTVTIDTATLPESTVRYLLDYGLKQSLADTYAGAKTPAEFEAALDKRLKAMTEGTMEIGSRTRTTDPVAREARKLATEKVDAQIKARGLNVPKEQRAKFIAELAARDDIVKVAKANVAKAAAIADDGLDALFAEAGLIESEPAGDESNAA